MEDTEEAAAPAKPEPDQAPSQADRAPPFNPRTVEMVVGLISPIMARLVARYGITAQDVQMLFLKGADRLNDMRALVHGGELTNGTGVTGAADNDARLRRIEQKIDALAEQISELADVALEVDG